MITKKCTKCKIEKNLNKFYKSQKYYRSHCKDCMKQYFKQNENNIKQYREKRLKEIKQWYNGYKSTLKCRYCDEDFTECLEFHHLKPETKIDNVVYMVHNGVSLEKIKKEMDKCIVVCANCHRKIHYGRIKI